MHLLTICGSLRAASSNRAALQAAALLAPPGTHVTLYDGLAALPHFNPDLDHDAPPPLVAALRKAVGLSDGVVISSPEYARGLAGSMKNALDWLVASDVFPGKPVMLINASPRATHAEAQMREVLRTMAARLVEDACVTLPLIGRALDAQAIATDPALATPLAEALRTFTRAIAVG